MSFWAYPAYRESGIAWIGRVPNHWLVAPLKAVVEKIESGTSVNADERPADNGEWGVLKTSCVYSGAFDASQNKAIVTEEYSRASCPVQVGTLIVSRMNTPDLVGAAGLVEQEAHGVFLPDRLWQMHFRGAFPKFVYYWTCSAGYRGQVQVACSGTSSSMQNLSQGQILAFAVPLPPLSEQSAIAAFLDRETGKIDALVAEQERLIALLKEKRQAVISQAVTKGLDASAPMNDSGVAWLGQVPAHWEVAPLKHLADFINGEAFKPTEWSDDGTPIIRIQNLNGGDEFNCYNGEVNPRHHVQKGDLLFGWSGNRGTSFGPFVWPREGLHYLNQHIFKVDPRSCNVGWFYWCLRAVTIYVEEQAHGIIGMVHVTKGVLGAIPVPLPPPAEQAAIAAFLDRKTGDIDTLTSEAHRAIALLRERRAALISAAVTGKIDVRGAVPEAQVAA